jgi:hypothetical protein
MSDRKRSDYDNVDVGRERGIDDPPMSDKMVEEIARAIYATLHHQMRVTGTDAQELYARAAQAAATIAERRMEEMREALRSIMDEQDRGDGSAPGHAHSRRGIWDDDAGNAAVGRANLPCDWCATWAKARAALRPSGGV